MQLKTLLAAAPVREIIGPADRTVESIAYDSRRVQRDGLFAAQCHEEAIPLHTARVIRDAFHRAISWADDFANGSRGEKSFELHEDGPFLCPGVNGAEGWL